MIVQDDPTMLDLIAHNLAPIMFITVMAMLLLGYPVAFTLAAGGMYFFDDDAYIDAAQVNRELSSMREVSKLRMLMSSMGGDVNAAFSICNRLTKQVKDGHIAAVETVAEGPVGSAMTLLLG